MYYKYYYYYYFYCYLLNNLFCNKIFIFFLQIYFTKVLHFTCVYNTLVIILFFIPDWPNIYEVSMVGLNRVFTLFIMNIHKFMELLNNLTIFSLFCRDYLLLETGFLCIFIAPLLYSPHNKRSTPSDTVTFWTVRWLLFRLIFSTGAGKLISQCPRWWKLSGNVCINFNTKEIL